MSAFVIVLILASGATRVGTDVYPTMAQCTQMSLMALQTAKRHNLHLPAGQQDEPTGVSCQAKK